MEQSYGTTDGTKDLSFAKTHVMHKRRRMNIAGLWLSLFIPWIIFCAVSAVRSFSVRFTNPGLTYGIILGIAVFIFASLVLAYQGIQRKRHHDPRYQPMWYVFLAVTSLLAFIVAWGFSTWNWNKNMSMFYNNMNLNDYFHVDPARMRGQQIMDAGSVHFVNTSHLDLKYSMGFRNDEVYCVAPINSVQSPLSNYDFWAVGLNCCSGTAADFTCGHYQDPNAHSGMRWMRDSQRPFFRLAVQQAEAAYGIKSNHPLFFTWIQDPVAEQATYLADGWKSYFLGMFTYFFFQLFLVIVAAVAFTKVGTF
jgi:hypothetical protein